MTSYDVTIQMKALCLYLHMVLFIFQKLSQNEIWKFGQNLLLAKFGSERANYNSTVYAKYYYGF